MHQRRHSLPPVRHPPRAPPCVAPRFRVTRHQAGGRRSDRSAQCSRNASGFKPFANAPNGSRFVEPPREVPDQRGAVPDLFEQTEQLTTLANRPRPLRRRPSSSRVSPRASSADRSDARSNERSSAFGFDPSLGRKAVFTHASVTRRSRNDISRVSAMRDPEPSRVHVLQRGDEVHVGQSRLAAPSVGRQRSTLACAVVDTYRAWAGELQCSRLPVVAIDDWRSAVRMDG